MRSNAKPTSRPIGTQTWARYFMWKGMILQTNASLQQILNFWIKNFRKKLPNICICFNTISNDTDYTMTNCVSLWIWLNVVSLAISIIRQQLVIISCPTYHLKLIRHLVHSVRQNEADSLESAGDSVGHGHPPQPHHGHHHPGGAMRRERGPPTWSGNRSW